MCECAVVQGFLTFISVGHTLEIFGVRREDAVLDGRQQPQVLWPPGVWDNQYLSALLKDVIVKTWSHDKAQCLVQEAPCSAWSPFCAVGESGRVQRRSYGSRIRQEALGGLGPLLFVTL